MRAALRDVRGHRQSCRRAARPHERATCRMCHNDIATIPCMSTPLLLRLLYLFIYEVAVHFLATPRRDSIRPLHRLLSYNIPFFELPTAVCTDSLNISFNLSLCFSLPPLQGHVSDPQPGRGWVPLHVPRRRLPSAELPGSERCRRQRVGVGGRLVDPRSVQVQAGAAVGGDDIEISGAYPYTPNPDVLPAQ